MKKLTLKLRKLLYFISNIEKRHKMMTYGALLLLTMLGYLLRKSLKLDETV